MTTSAARGRGRHPLVGRLMMERLAADLYAKDVAAAAGIKRDTLADMENGRRNPSLWAFDAIARAMGYVVSLTPLNKKPCSSCGCSCATQTESKEGASA